MSPKDSSKRTSARWRQIRTWICQQTGSGGEAAQIPRLTDAETMAAWTPVSQDDLGRWCFNPLLDLPLKAHAGMNKVKLWEMFVCRLAEGEVRNLLDLERSWAKSPERRLGESATLQIIAGDETAWHDNREAPLRPSDLAAAVIIWLWHNGLRREAVSVLERIWQTMRDQQECNTPGCIPWPAQSALDGFRVAAHRDWDDSDQAEFAAMFRDLHVDKKIDQEIEILTS